MAFIKRIFGGNNHNSINGNSNTNTNIDHDPNLKVQQAANEAIINQKIRKVKSLGDDLKVSYHPSTKVGITTEFSRDGTVARTIIIHDPKNYQNKSQIISSSKLDDLLDELRKAKAINVKSTIITNDPNYPDSGNAWFVKVEWDEPSV